MSNGCIPFDENGEFKIFNICAELILIPNVQQELNPNPATDIASFVPSVKNILFSLFTIILNK